MEKILLALDGVQMNTGVLDFSSWLALSGKAKITAVFLDNLLTEERLVAQGEGINPPVWQLDKAAETQTRKNLLLQQNISVFKQAFDRQGVRYAVHEDKGDPAKEIIRESRYADLLVVDPATSFNNSFEGCPTPFVRDILTDAECPVIIAPGNFEGINEIIFTWDGGRSSMFAIKQFCHLFPGMDDKRVTLLKVNQNGEEAVCTELKEWMSSHYSVIGFETLEGDAATALLAYLLKKKQVLIVMGAYGRNQLSRFFKHSLADLLIKTLNQALFIAHQ
jgi:nucleotide-binding universal stress UspA family protein